MANSRNDSEQVQTGRALKALREARGLTQPAAAARVGPDGISVQAWQNYEAGRRRFTPALVAKVTAALGATPEDLALERVHLPPAEEPGYGPGVAEAASPLVGIVTETGQLLVRRFHHIVGGKLFVQDVNDNSLVAFELDQVQGVHAVTFRGR